MNLRQIVVISFDKLSDEKRTQPLFDVPLDPPIVVISAEPVAGHKPFQLLLKVQHFGHVPLISVGLLFDERRF